MQDTAPKIQKQQEFDEKPQEEPVSDKNFDEVQNLGTEIINFIEKSIKKAAEKKSHQAFNSVYAQVQNSFGKGILERYKQIIKEKIKPFKERLPAKKLVYNKKEKTEPAKEQKKIFPKKNIEPQPKEEPKPPKQEIQETLEVEEPEDEFEEEPEEEYQEEIAISEENKKPLYEKRKEQLDKIKEKIQKEIEKAGFNDMISYKISDIIDTIEELHPAILKLFSGKITLILISDIEEFCRRLITSIQNLEEEIKNIVFQIPFIFLITKYLDEARIYHKTTALVLRDFQK